MTRDKAKGDDIEDNAIDKQKTKPGRKMYRNSKMERCKVSQQERCKVSQQEDERKKKLGEDKGPAWHQVKRKGLAKN